jgi:peptidoglycan/xylan/chitin deacetylase (PgdA/CDA1 family)
VNWKTIDILMFHSLTEGPGPTHIGAETFRKQMQAIAECGYHGVPMADLAPWMRGENQPTGKPIVLTFDDGFTDFAEVAFPELHARGWKATVFLPAGKVGQAASWDTWPGRPVGKLMSWRTVEDLADQGIEIGAHGISHSDLTMLPLDVARREIVDSGRRIEDRLGRPVTSFAAPFGKTNANVNAEIRRHYRAAVGTHLARARPSSDLFHLPRIEMWYFRKLRRWRSYLEGGERTYFLLRQVLRRLRALAS